MVAGIYEIVDISTGRKYIGQSVNIANRWNEHRSGWGNKEVAALVNKNKNSSEDLIEYNVLEEVSTTKYNPNQLSYILNLLEVKYVQQNGGVNSEFLMNKAKVTLSPRPKGISQKDYSVEILDKDSLVYNYQRLEKKIGSMEGNLKYYQDRSRLLFNKNEDLENKINLLKYQVSNLAEKIENQSDMFKEHMQLEYVTWKSNKTVAKLEDDILDKDKSIQFWKERANYWRNLYYESKGE